MEALDRGRYSLLPVEIRRDGSWGIPAPTLLEEGGGPLLGCGPAFGGIGVGDVRGVLARAVRERSLDVAVLALHGAYGEDGTLQGLLEAAGLPYTGSGVLASALAMDKARAKVVVAAAGVRVARGACVARAAWEAGAAAVLDALAGDLGERCFVKPACGGSSLGAGPAAGRDALRARVEEVFAGHGDAALVEEELAGREVTCAVLGNRGGPLRTLPLVEVVPQGRPFFDYAAKYDPASCREICPARVTAEARVRTEDAALAAHRALGCDGMSRSDFILVGGEPVYLETNTIPGMTAESLCPKAARAAGLPFRRLLDLLVGMALERGPARRGKAGGREAGRGSAWRRAG
jgi:D-alanine-D-alanine ligase